MRHFIDICDHSVSDLRLMLDYAMALKAGRLGKPKGSIDRDCILDGHLLAMIFEKPSTRTRTSFSVAMRQLGGDVLSFSQSDLHLGLSETIEDTARVLSRYVDAIMLRGKDHESLYRLASSASVPVLNGLTDFSHPCQIMADLLTLEEHCGIAGSRVLWCGDVNNVARSWVHAASRFDFSLTLACPSSLVLPEDVLLYARGDGARMDIVHDLSGLSGFDCVVTDVWVSMGDEDSVARRRLFEPFRVTDSLLSRMSDECIFMHCLPACRGAEVTDEVLDGPHSVVWDEAENRLHVQKAILAWCFEKI